MEQSISKKIIRNTFFNAIGRFWGILTALALTPYIIGHLGIERYGIWAIVGVLTGYFGLLDFGIGTSFVKYISEYYAKKDFQKINQLINTGLVCYSIFTVLIVSSAIFAIDTLLGLLNIPGELYSEAHFVFLLGITIFCISNTLSVFRAVQGGLQRMDISSKITIAVSIPNIAGTIFFLESGYSLPGLMVNNAIMLGISSIINIVIAFRILPELKLSHRLFSGEMFKRLFRFGYKLQIARISSMISIHIDKLLISYFLSIGLVTFYQLASSIVEKTKSIALLFLTALVPAFSEIDANGEREKLIEGYIRGTKYLALVVAPLFTIIIIQAPQIMVIWMGTGYEKSALVIQILGAGWLCALLIGVRGALTQAIAKPEIEMKAGLVATILNLPLSIIFIMQFGFTGVAFGTSIALFFSVIYGTIKLHREIQLPIGQFLKTTMLKTLTVCICIGLPLWTLNALFKEYFFSSSRLTGTFLFIIQTLLFMIIYLKILLHTKPFDNVDFTMLTKDKPLFIKNLILKFNREATQYSLAGKN